MIASSMVKEMLEHQDICPRCGASWLELEKSLNEPMDSPNWYIALTIVRNCEICMARFEIEIINGGKE